MVYDQTTARAEKSPLKAGREYKRFSGSFDLSDRPFVVRADTRQIYALNPHHFPTSEYTHLHERTVLMASSKCDVLDSSYFRGSTLTFLESYIRALPSLSPRLF